MNKLILLAVLAVFGLTGCATDGEKAFGAAHESASKSGIEKAKAWAEVEKTKYAAIGSAAMRCESDACRAAAMMATTAVSSKSEAPENKQLQIAAYQDPALQAARIVKDGVLGFFGIRARLGENFLNAIRPAADASAAREALRMGDFYTDTTTAK